MTRNGPLSEHTPLLSPSVPKPRQLRARWHQHLAAKVSRSWADCILILCYLITGLLDSASISVWGSFVSMQTGNTVYLGLGLAAPSASTRWIKSAVSISAFCVGSFLFSRFHRRFTPTRRWVLAVSFTAQACLTTVAAGLVTSAGPPPDPENLGWPVLVPIALVAFQSCGQAVVSRALDYNALTSVVLTSVYCDLFSDARLFKLGNVQRNRRSAAPLFLLVGAFLGGHFADSSWGVAGALWAASILKFALVVVWLVWPAENLRVEES
ncbi:hypothetical protein F5144DRAFT_578097 [Chaetomium tenue]|uniref:Uncharacterized protein n=1 Tax=Chaetomium tenue TaxID=1854479 RepID=A0ACB7P290_9PEZI|nr:hypothetical protein F5144DRAFT_578097 [Chaetomium globosum]